MSVEREGREKGREGMAGGSDGQVRKGGEGRRRSSRIKNFLLTLFVDMFWTTTL